MRRRLIPKLAAAAALAVLAGAMWDQPAQAAGLLIADGGLGGVLEIKQHDVRVTVNNGVAVTEVEQVFVNTESRVVEALYTFPVPNRASVANFSMWINGKEMTGEVVEKERARQIYESYKAVKRDPGLLEQVNYKTFEMRIFPIPAGAEQRVKIAYYQELDYDHDWASYVYPLATTSQKDIDQRTRGRFSLTLDVKSEIPLVKMKSTSHADDFAIVQHADNHYWQASLETSGGDLSRDVVLAFQTKRPRTGLDAVGSRTAGEDGYFMMTLTAGKELEESLGDGADYVFLLDVSGSMAMEGKLGLSRSSVFAFIDSLGEKDRVEVITFNVGANKLFGAMTVVGAEQKEQARVFLESQKARGGTVLRPALDAAYRYAESDRHLNVVVMSDGMTEQNEQRELLDLIQRRPSSATVFCVGVGNEVNRPLLSQLAQDAGGLAAFISAGDDFERQAEAFRRKLTRPAATNVKLAIQGIDAYDIEPQTLPNLYYGQPLRIYGRYRKGGEATVDLQAEILGSPLRQALQLTLPENDANNPEIERMWAWHRVQRLSDDARRTGSVGSVKDEIVRLCEGYSIASEYASFIVLENDGEYQRWKIERRNATRIQRDRRSLAAVQERLVELRRQSEQQLVPAAAAASRPASAESPLANLPAQNNQPVTMNERQPNDLALGPQFQPQSSSPGPGPIHRPRFGGGGSGGGAIDPVTACIAVGLAAAGWMTRRRAG